MSPSQPTATTLAKVVGIYRWRDGAHFDPHYYHAQHAALALRLLSPWGLLRFESDTVAQPRAPREGDVLAMSVAYFPSLAHAHTAVARAGQELAADLPGYTNLRPELHLTECRAHGAS